MKFSPILKDKIWGGKKLKELLNKSEATDISGESWELSGVEGELSVVTNGFLSGNNIEELSEVYMGDLLGQKVFSKFGTKFPLLIKFIDATDDLSIQVHPNDEQAMERHNSFGKTEMWYVMQADKDASLIAGFNQEVNKEKYLNALEQKKLLDILNTEKVSEGDVFFMPAGRVHAIGTGCLIAEIQQTSDITYRIYDFDRTDDKGQTRELHTEQAVDVIDYNYYKTYKTIYTSKENSPVILANCQYFTTNIIELSDSIERDMNAFDSFVVYMCLEGEADIICEKIEDTHITKGETVLIPAEIAQYYLKATDKAKLIEVYIGKSENED